MKAKRLITTHERNQLKLIIEQLDRLRERIEKRAWKDGINIDYGDCEVYNSINASVAGCIEAIEQDELFLNQL